MSESLRPQARNHGVVSLVSAVAGIMLLIAGSRILAYPVPIGAKVLTAEGVVWCASLTITLVASLIFGESLS